MCYMIILSTTASDDLSLANSELLTFSKDLPGIAAESLLRYNNRWFVGSSSGCSCEFRHLGTPSFELGFAEPVDWFQENESAIEATRQFSKVIRALVERGEQVECIAHWAASPCEFEAAFGEMEINLNVVTDTTFRFFENQRFSFTLR